MIEETNFTIRTNSMNELMKENIYFASMILPITITKIISGKYRVIDTNKRKSNYYLFPKYSDFKDFYKNGCMLI